MPSLDALLRGLSDPGAYPEEDWAGTAPAARRVEVVQTHISAVFLTTRTAYKVKKPLRLWGFLDYGTREQRRHWCEEEVRLNRRLAPDVYLGVTPVVEGAGGRLLVGGASGEPVEHAVRMRRFAEASTLAARLEAGGVTPADLERLGEVVGRFHAQHALSAEQRAGVPPAAFRSVLAQNVSATRAFVPALFPAAVHDDVERRFAGVLEALAPRLAARHAPSRLVDGHGDLRLEHVLLEASGPAVIDCVEFTTTLRHIDRCSDAAFLVMDLLAHGRPDLARVFARAWVRATGDPGDGLWGLYAAYRAHVRAKVDATTSAEGEVPAAQRAAKAVSARHHLALAWSLLRQGAAPAALVLVRGLSGSGKSVLAAALAPWLMATHVRSDVVRKALFGLAPLARPSGREVDALYSPAASERTYAEVLRQGLASAEAGLPALLDATFLKRAHREPVYEAARRAALPVVVVDVSAPDAVVRQRLTDRRARGDDASDADTAVYEAQVLSAEPVGPGEADIVLPHVSGTDPSRLLLAILERLVARTPGAPPAAGGPVGAGLWGLEGP